MCEQSQPCRCGVRRVLPPQCCQRRANTIDSPAQSPDERYGSGAQGHPCAGRERRPRSVCAVAAHGAWLFPNREATGPLRAIRRQKTFAAVVRTSGLTTHASMHTWRYSYATHLLECGVHRRTMQEGLGHQSPAPTAVYTPITPMVTSALHATVNTRMATV